MNKKSKVLFGISMFCFLASIFMIETSLSASLCYLFFAFICLFFSIKNKQNILKVKKCYYLKRKNIKNVDTITNLNKQKNDLKDEINLMKLTLSEESSSKLYKKLLVLKTNISELEDKKTYLINEIDKLKEDKAILLEQINNMEYEKEKYISIPNDTFSIEYIDSLEKGLDFEKVFSLILEKLDYKNIKITSNSGDFGIDVLAEYDDILYGFQCKLYSNTVGNSAIQEAYTGKKHYNCNVAVVVTNNFFTEQAKKQAIETNVILWDRNILIKKIKEANKYNIFIN